MQNSVNRIPKFFVPIVSSKNDTLMFFITKSLSKYKIKIITDDNKKILKFGDKLYLSSKIPIKKIMTLVIIKIKKYKLLSKNNSCGKKSGLTKNKIK